MQLPSLVFLLLLQSSARRVTREDRCTVDIVRAIPHSRFLREYYLKRPVIIRGVDVDLWSLPSLVAAHGNVLVATGTSSDLTRDRGSGKRRVTLAELAQRVQAHDGPEGSTAEHFAFERNPALFNVAPHLTRNLKPQLLLLNRSSRQSAVDWYFSLGKRDSGVHMHHHTDGFALIHAGVKRFFFYAAWSTLPPITSRSRFPIRQWLDERVYPKLLPAERPHECSALAGDLVYVPEGWFHATIVESEYALAVAAQLREPASPPGKMWREIVDRNALDAPRGRRRRNVIEETLEKVKAMVNQWPGCAEAWQFGGSLASELNRPATWKKTLEELLYKEKAFAISPRNCEIAHNYAIALMKSRQLDKASSVLANATELCGAWEHRLWLALSKVHELKGDNEAARSAALQSEKIQKAEYERLDHGDRKEL